MSSYASGDSAGHNSTSLWIAQLQGGEWQPLRTAPRDGSKIDVWTEGGFRYIDVFWYEGAGYPGGAFVYYDSNLRDLMDVDDATHWMPPPAPPGHEKVA